MKARVTRVYRRLSKRRDDLKALPNYRLEAKRPVAINQQWSSDITYIKLGKKYVFLAVVLDLFSRRIISWRLGENLSADFARATLREAFISRVLHLICCSIRIAASNTGLTRPRRC